MFKQMHNTLGKTLIGLMMILLAACGGGSLNNGQSAAGAAGTGPATVPAPAVLCVSSSCGSSSVIATVPDAENILFTPEGRLFVSGGIVVEVIRNGMVFSTSRIDDGSCGGNGHTGLAQIGRVIYNACIANNMLYAADLSASNNLAPIHDLNTMTSPMDASNGMAVDHLGRLYVVNGPTGAIPKVVRVILDDNNPLNVVDQQDWLTTGLEFPNGIVFDGQQTFYITDSSVVNVQFGTVKRVVLNADGSAGTPQTIFVSNSILDDISLTADGRILVSGFSTGQVFLLDSDGTLLQQTNPQTWRAASAVQQGQPPLFSDTDILVTDKGVIGDQNSNIGNVLTVFRATP